MNASANTYNSGHQYYTALKKLNHAPVPTFRGNHSWLCEEQYRDHMYFGYCLPISGRKDTPFCADADRMDLLKVPSPNSTCYASVLHMLLVEVYEELKATGNTPLVTFGSLLGAVRNQSMIPFTEDTDIGFVDELKAVGNCTRVLNARAITCSGLESGGFAWRLRTRSLGICIIRRCHSPGSTRCPMWTCTR